MNTVTSDPSFGAEMPMATVLRAAQEELGNSTLLNITMSGQCCAAVEAVSNEGCLCDASVGEVLSALTIDNFVGLVEDTFADSCGAPVLHVYPDPACDAIVANATSTGGSEETN